MSEVKNIPDGWVETTLGKAIDIKHGYAFKGEFISLESNNKVLITPGNFKVGGGFKGDKFKYYTGDFPEDYILRPNDVIVTMTDLSKAGDTLGFSAKIPKDTNEYLHNQRIGLVKFINSEFDEEFIYWFLRTNHYQKSIVNSSTGSTVRHTSPNRIREYTFYCPRIEEQKAIASILTAFDDKIELLQAQNKTLEATAQTIFAEWFGKYNVDDELPSGWRIGKLSEIANLKSGFAFKAEDFIEESNFKAIKIKDLKGNGNISLSDVSAITEEITKLDRVQYFKLDEGDILLAMSGNTTGKIGVLPSSENEIYLNQRVGKFFMKDKKYNSFLYNFLMSGSFEEKILGMGYGSAQPNINPSQIENIVIIYPDETKMNDYLNISNPIFEKVLKNNTQIQTLTKTRDELLPRLMSGEVRVNEFKV